jgi:hypothetical protein
MQKYEKKLIRQNLFSFSTYSACGLASPMLPCCGEMRMRASVLQLINCCSFAVLLENPKEQQKNSRRTVVEEAM